MKHSIQLSLLVYVFFVLTDIHATVHVYNRNDGNQSVTCDSGQCNHDIFYYSGNGAFYVNCTSDCDNITVYCGEYTPPGDNPNQNLPSSDSISCSMECLQSGITCSNISVYCDPGNSKLLYCGIESAAMNGGVITESRLECSGDYRQYMHPPPPYKACYWDCYGNCVAPNVFISYNVLGFCDSCGPNVNQTFNQTMKPTAATLAPTVVPTLYPTLPTLAPSTLPPTIRYIFHDKFSDQSITCDNGECNHKNYYYAGSGSFELICISDCENITLYCGAFTPPGYANNSLFNDPDHVLSCSFICSSEFSFTTCRNLNLFCDPGDAQIRWCGIETVYGDGGFITESSLECFGDYTRYLSHPDPEKACYWDCGGFCQKPNTFITYDNIIGYCSGCNGKVTETFNLTRIITYEGVYVYDDSYSGNLTITCDGDCDNEVFYFAGNGTFEILCISDCNDISVYCGAFTPPGGYRNSKWFDDPDNIVSCTFSCSGDASSITCTNINIFCHPGTAQLNLCGIESTGVNAGVITQSVLQCSGDYYQYAFAQKTCFFNCSGSCLTPNLLITYDGVLGLCNECDSEVELQLNATRSPTSSPTPLPTFTPTDISRAPTNAPIIVAPTRSPVPTTSTEWVKIESDNFVSWVKKLPGFVTILAACSCFVIAICLYCIICYRYKAMKRVIRNIGADNNYEDERDFNRNQSIQEHVGELPMHLVHIEQGENVGNNEIDEIVEDGEDGEDSLEEMYMEKNVSPVLRNVTFK